jgi:GNAT superfamily N-acetyltransferase
MALSEARSPPAVRGADDALRLVTLAPADIDAGLALSDAAGWNQTADDWAIFIRNGHAIGFRDDADRLVATAVSLPYGASAGWISMVLVADAWRHRGLASALMAACVERLRAANIVPILDATPAGAAVYARIGFAAGFEIDRWEWKAASAPVDAALGAMASSALAIRAADASELDLIVALDRASNGLDRRFLLEGFLSRPGTRAWLSGTGRGFVVARQGRRATQIGPLVAGSESEAVELLAAAFVSAGASAGRDVFLDLPRARAALRGWLEAQGFVRQRPFVRMSLGAAQPPTLGRTCFVLAGPEFG